MNRQEALRQLPLPHGVVRRADRLCLKTPGLRKQGSLRPTEQGTALAKDVWLLGIGLSLTFDGLAGKGGRR